MVQNCVGVAWRNDRERATALLLGDSDGGYYPPYVVLKSKRSTVEGGELANCEKRRGFGI